MIITPPVRLVINKLLIVSFIIFSLFIVSCDLFTGPKVDLFQVISDEVDWANAPKLTVSVAFPPEWGNSPQSGEGKCGDTRKGYEFGVEFTPLSGFGFEKWLAFYTADYADQDKNLSYSEVEGSSLNGKGVNITESTSDTGAKTAKITVNITEPVTLVPWCNSRPRLTQQTNPPLNPILTPFPFNQTVNIWFNMNIKPESAVLGDTITVKGIYASSIGNNERGQPFKGNGDLSSYFTLVFPAANRIALTPIEETANELALLSINITVGPGIKNLNGVTMAQAETISYQTDSKEAQKAYRAEYIKASRNGSNWFGDTADYPWNSPSIDRRFNKSDKNTAHIRFSVNPPEGAPSVPNKIKVVEKLSYDLRGFNAAGQSCEEEYSGVIPSGGVYTITHTLQTASSGIIQILILPWYDDDASIMPLQANEAVAEGQYVTVVMDLSAPDVNNLNARLNTPSSTEIRENKTIHVYGSGAEITLTVDGLENLADNGAHGGIQAAQAWGLPWTMDNISNLYWYVRIGEDNQAEKKTSERLNVYNGLTLNKTWSPEVITNLQDPGGYRVYVKFEDSMGNMSLDWKDSGLIVKYSMATITPVSGLKAVCNSAGNSITVSWTIPDYMTGAYVFVNGMENMIDDRDFVSEETYKQEYSFPVSIINTSGVMSGQAVRNVTRYDISVVAYNPAGRAAERTLSIWNIEDMNITQTNTVILNQSNFTTALASTDTNNFVLVEDITLSNWTPLTGNFTGKFYGNGHTITVSGNFTDAAYTGVFGNVSGVSAEIRDLTVNYRTNAAAGSSAVYIGGLAGYAGAGAKLRNIAVIGAYGVVLSYTNANTAAKMTRFGGIAGELNGAGTLLENAYSNLNMYLSSGAADNVANNTRVGGIAGYMENASITNCVWAAGTNLTVTKCEGRLFAGGIAGKFYSNTGTSVSAPAISETRSRGNITVKANHHLQLGGLTGQASGATGAFLKFVNSVYETGEIRAVSTATAIEGGSERCTVTNVGGFTGTFGSAKRYTGGNQQSMDSIDTEDNNKGPYINGNGVNSAGIIVSYLGNGILNLGGFIGSLSATDISGAFANCPLTLSEDGNVLHNNIGGFIGFIIDSAVINNCHSNMPINLITNSKNSTNSQAFGGFAGGSFSVALVTVFTIEQCSASGNVFVKTGSSSAYCGGFAGYLPGANINKCKATGSVKVQTSAPVNNTNGNIIGGLLGNVYSSTIISNCYATGNVEIDNPYYTSVTGRQDYAGGLIGSVFDRPVENCFALGSVTIQTNTLNIVRAGGLVGNSSRGGNQVHISKCVALGETIVVKSVSTNIGIRRICNPNSSALFDYNNYALNAMYLEKWDNYRNGSVSPVTAEPIAEGQDGADVTMSELVTWGWWSDPARGFDNGAWSSVGIERGYPRLAWEME